ncbi:hypothetical protein JTB14_005163 [Gonioctena quinquepunctata]|nr:hypothetical protein JTB14_005163 [Gonioctena quinquepunctata]
MSEEVMIYFKLSLDEKTKNIWKKDKFCRIIKRKKCPTKPVEVVFQSMLGRFRRVRTLQSVYSKLKITQILDEVIRNDYFGSTQNRKRFYHLVNKITTQSRFECIYVSSLSKGYNIKVIPWLQQENINEKESQKLLHRANYYLLKYIVKPLIKHFYHPLKSFKDYEVKFIERRKWHSFQQKNFNQLLKLGHLTPAKEIFQRSRGVLRLFPKTDCDSLEYRPLISPFKRDKTTKFKFKRLSVQIEILAKKFSMTGSNKSLYKAWNDYVDWICDDEIYGIKLDIKDAFGSVDIGKLSQVINESNFSKGDKQFLVDHIQNQYVSYNKKVYKWNHGLLQGDHLSSSLCNLYMSVLEKEHFQCFVKTGNFIHRIVDDYMFCSIEKSEVDTFETKTMEIFHINETKTERAGVGDSTEINYYGQVIDLKTREVSKFYKFPRGQSIRHKFKFWNIKRTIPENSKAQFIMNTLRFSYNNHCFKKIELNTIYNSEKCVLINYFKGMIHIAFKFDAAVMSLREFQEDVKDMPYLSSTVDNVVYNYSNILFYKLQQSKGPHHSGYITFQLLKNIGYRAFILVLKKNNEFYKTLINKVESNNSLYLYLDNIIMEPKTFTILPPVFSGIRMNRKSKI